MSSSWTIGGGGGGGTAAVPSFRLHSTAAPPDDTAALAEQVDGGREDKDDDDDDDGQGENKNENEPLKINVHTVPKPDLERLLQSWGHPKYRATQILQWIRGRGASSFDEMTDLPAKLREDLKGRARIGSLEVAAELRSDDGTRKRAYRLWDGQLIESVLMPYEDGRNTACVSSQAGCAMGCVFCATGQMGFARQLTSDEIFEQVARFASELKAESNGEKRLTNVVMMGMGEPLANYRNLMAALRRMNDELGIGARRITVSTVGIVPNIRKLAREDLQVKLAVSLHCSTEEERSALLPANRRYGGIDELLSAVREYIDLTRRRVTFEWALIEGQNDTPEVARSLGNLLKRHGIRRDMSHVNVIPLNPTGGFGGSPSGRRRVAAFVRVLEEDFGIGATPRMRRGIDIDAGCGQLKAAVKKKEGQGNENENENMADLEGAEEGGAPSSIGKEEDDGVSQLNAARDELQSFLDEVAATSPSRPSPIVGVYEDDDYEAVDQREDDDVDVDVDVHIAASSSDAAVSSGTVDFTLHDAALDLDEHEGEVIDDDFDQDEADRLIALVQGCVSAPLAESLAPPPPPPPPPPPAVDAADVSSKTKKTAASTADDAVADADAADVVSDAVSTTEMTKTTTITDETAVRKAKRRRKKLLKNLRQIDRLREIEDATGRELNDEQKDKVAREDEWRAEIESLEHNLM